MPQTDEDGKVIVPGLYPATVLGRARKILDATDEFVGKQADGTVVRGIMEAIAAAVLPKKKESFGPASVAVHRTVADVTLGEVFTPVKQKQVALRIAGNIKAVTLGVAVLTWASNQEQEWALLYCSNYDARVGKGGRRGAFLFFDVITGSAAGREIRQFFSKEHIESIANRIGVKDKWDMRPFHPGELVGTYCPCLLAAGTELLVDSVWDPVSAVKSANSKLTQARLDRVCAFGRTRPCALCDIGYDQCELGCHRYTYVDMPCTCSETRNWPEALADPAKMEHPSFCCERCPRRARMTV